MPSFPSVQKGLVNLSIPGHGKIELPKAILDRMRYSQRVSGQEPMSDQGLLESRFKPLTSKYAAYDPGLSKVLESMGTKYAGEGRAVRETSAYQRAAEAAKQRRGQQSLLRTTGAARRQVVDPSGQVKSDTGKTVSMGDLASLRKGVDKAEKKTQRQMMLDREKLFKLSRPKVTSNLPVVLKPKVAKV